MIGNRNTRAAACNSSGRSRFSSCTGQFSTLPYLAIDFGVQLEKGEISHNGAHIHHVAYGKGKPVVVLHGGFMQEYLFAILPKAVALAL